MLPRYRFLIHFQRGEQKRVFELMGVLAAMANAFSGKRVASNKREKKKAPIRDAIDLYNDHSLL